MASKKRAELQRYRSLYAKAKANGLLAKPKDARSVKISKYMKGKLNKLEPYLSGEYTSVKVDRKVARQYRDAPTSWTPVTFGDRVIVPKSVARAFPKSRGGKLVFVRPLKDGEHELIPVPIKATTVEAMLEEISGNPIYQQSKREDENFAFRIYGNASWETFGNLEALTRYIAEFYPHIEENETNLDDDDESKIPLLIYREKKNWRMAGERIEKARRRRSIKRRKLRKDMTPEQIERAREKYARRMEYYKKVYPEKYQEQLEKRRDYAKKRREKMTPEQVERWREKERIKKRIQREAESDVQKEIRLLKERARKDTYRDGKKGPKKRRLKRP